VMWRCVCQSVEWFMGLFGYKRNDGFARCIWRLFATSAAFITTVVAIALLCFLVSEGKSEYRKRFHTCDDECCWAVSHVTGDIYFHNHYNGKGYVFNMRTGEKLLKNLEWIAEPNGKDSLVCFSNGEKRGYFSKNTGKVVIEPKYSHAWIFSEGLAGVVEDGFVKFIDGTGKVVIDNRMSYASDADSYVFHCGYCVIGSEADDDHYGMMDRNGNLVMQTEYDEIRLYEDQKVWRVRRGQEMAVLDCELKPIIPFMECFIYISEGTIDLTMPDHTMRKCDMQGTLIHDFYIASVRTLEYEKDEILYRTRTHDDNGDEYAVPFVESYHPQATARLRAYVAGDSYEGLMTAEGRVVTMPLYKDIVALDHDLYLCEVTNGDKVVVNGKGEIVK